MLVLTLETTCDETAAAIINDRLEVLSAVVASQEELHGPYHGVVPEIAARAHVERILPVIDQTLKRANLSLDQLDAVAVANTPGLAGSLLVGVMAAKTICLAIGKPLVSVNHLHAHVYACRFASESREEIFPCLGFIVSGGHTNLYLCRDPFSFDYLGGTIDDAAGEAFDKVASMLGLPYPGGPQISRIAEQGSPTAFRFPRSFIKDAKRLQFSFSGLKTAVRYAICGPEKPDFDNTHLTDQQKADLAASFQAAVVDSLVIKAFHAIDQTGVNTLCVGGGVAANGPFRDRLESEAAARQVRLIVAPRHLCTDNAVMGAIAIEKLKAGKTESLDLDILPGLVR